MARRASGAAGRPALIASAEAEVARGEHAARPYVLVAQQSLFDPSRAPGGAHTLWAYCHVPNGSPIDAREAIEAQIERFAPGFRDRILARSTHSPAALEIHDPNYIGGDINAGIQDIRQLIFRPRLALDRVVRVLLRADRPSRRMPARQDG